MFSQYELANNCVEMRAEAFARKVLHFASGVSVGGAVPSTI